MSYLLGEYVFLLYYISFSSTLQFDLTLEIELFAFTLFIILINDSVLDQIGVRTLCMN